MKPTHSLHPEHVVAGGTRNRRAAADEIWRRLTTAARQVAGPSHADAATAADAAAAFAAPPGFATRVAAHALAQRRRCGPSLLEAFSLRALGLAGLAAAVALAAHLAVPQSVASVAAADEELFFTIEDPSTILLGENGGSYE